ncbi:SIMPL domain-containing protein [Heliomarina baculiformis]|uniref:SIMPL domain-containing protein n=1 Tax=Heliomarina baculiformis TaxID=2872036 RepID=UPI001EE28E0F|nr:SIMPL domain-containing protein [Heliomarina baculiformis]
MKPSILLAGVLAAFCATTAPALLAAQELTQSRQIIVNGEGEVTAAPDMATITLGVTHRADEAKAAMDTTSDNVAAILERLATLGVAESDMQTRNLTLNPVWSDNGRTDLEQNVITGFVASNTIYVRVRDLESLGPLLDAVIEDGANDFNGLQFSMQNPDPLMDEARKAAVKDAMAKAVLYADAAGIELGQVRSITEQGGGRPMMMEMAASARKGGVPIAAGEVTVSSSVSMVFDIVSP